MGLIKIFKGKSLKHIAFTILIFSYLIYFLGVFTKTEEFQNNYSDCQYLEGDFPLYGNEDAVMFNKDVLIGIHTSIHKIFTTKIEIKDVERGGFFAVYGISTGNLSIKKVKVNNHPTHLLFNPHGISIRINKLYAINHSYYTGGERVESYEIITNAEGQIELNYLHATVMDPQLNGVTNDVEFLNDDRFLISQWQIYPVPLKGNSEQSIFKTLAMMAAQVLKLKLTQAYDCKYVKDGKAICSVVESSEGIVVNGIAYDGDRTVAITDTLARSIKFYTLNDKQELKLNQTLYTSVMIDNLNYDSIQKQFIGSGSNTVYEYLTVNTVLNVVLNNKTNKSIVNYSAVVETYKKNETNTYESHLLFSSKNAVVTVSGALIDPQQRYLFLNNFSDKSIVVCHNTKSK